MSIWYYSYSKMPDHETMREYHITAKQQFLQDENRVADQLSGDVYT